VIFLNLSFYLKSIVFVCFFVLNLYYRFISGTNPNSPCYEIDRSINRIGKFQHTWLPQG